jgi:RNA polymerase sigma factor (sigma-70 family)
MKHLAPRLRRVLILRELGGLTVDETAERMGLDRRAVYWLRQRAVRRLRQLLQDE